MNPLDLIPAPYRLLAFALLLLAAFAAGGTAAWKVQGWRLGGEIAQIRADAALQRALATAAARRKERQHEQIARNAEQTRLALDAQRRRLATENRRLAAALGGLRDPGARAECVCADADAAGQPAGAAGTSAGLLSERATRFLLEFAEQCDAANDYAWAAHEWAKGLSAVD